MDLLKEAKKGNKDAYISLIDKYNVIFYKTARVYFTGDLDISDVLEKGLLNTYHEIINTKNERAFLVLALKELVLACKAKQKKNPKSKNIDDEEVSETLLKNTKYRMYKDDSIIERCVTSVDVNFRLPTLLYFYANLTPKEISLITDIPKSEVNNRIKILRDNLFNLLQKEEI